MLLKLPSKSVKTTNLLALMACFLFLAANQSFSQDILLNGSLEASNTFATDGALNPDQAVSCIEIVIPQDLDGANGLYLDFNTNGSTDVAGGGVADTELLLFDGNVAGGSGFIFSDDDGGPGTISAMTFGTGAGAGVHTGDFFSGEDGSLLAGTYTIIISDFSTNDPGVGASLNDFLYVNGDNGDEAVNWILNIYTNVPGLTAVIVEHDCEPNAPSFITNLPTKN